MENSYQWLEMDDGAEVYVRLWENSDKTPKAILQLAHGMAEHIERYDEFARYLLDKDIFVIGNDHRGHGKTGEKAGLFGYFADRGGFERVTDDFFQISKYIKKKYPDTPLYLMGHSMGSFIVRRYIQKYPSEAKGAILSGTGGNPGIAGKLGKWLASREIRKNGNKTASPTMDRLIFGSYNKGFEQAKNKFAWLSRDEGEVEKYLQDPYCGFICTTQFFYDLLTGLETIHRKENVELINKNLPIFIFSGEKDPVGGNTLGVKQVIHQYKKHGITNIEFKFYENGRHEMLNDINKEEVYEDIYHWLEKRVAAS